MVTTLDCEPGGLWFKSEWVSMRLDRLHRAYPSFHSFGVVHWVPVLSNTKTPTGVNRIDSCNFELCLLERLCITNNSTAFKDGPDTCIKYKMFGYHLANA